MPLFWDFVHNTQFVKLFLTWVVIATSTVEAKLVRFGILED